MVALCRFVIIVASLLFAACVLQINSVILCRVVCEMTKMQAAKDISNVK